MLKTIRKVHGISVACQRKSFVIGWAISEASRLAEVNHVVCLSLCLCDNTIIQERVPRLGGSLDWGWAERLEQAKMFSKLSLLREYTVWRTPNLVLIFLTFYVHHIGFMPLCTDKQDKMNECKIAEMDSVWTTRGITLRVNCVKSYGELENLRERNNCPKVDTAQTFGSSMRCSPDGGLHPSPPPSLVPTSGTWALGVGTSILGRMYICPAPWERFCRAAVATYRSGKRLSTTPICGEVTEDPPPSSAPILSLTC